MNEVAVLIRKASRMACGETGCGLDSPHTKSFCIECGLPADYPKLDPYGDLYELAVEEDPTAIPFDKALHWLLVAVWSLLILNALDVVVTLAALANGSTEMNPLAAWLIDTKLIYPAKLGVCAFAIGMAYAAKHQPGSLLRRLIASWFVTGIYAIVVVLNTIHYLIGRSSS